METGNILVIGAGILLSVVFGYVPKAATWFEALGPQHKALFMVALTAAAAGIVAAGSCWLNYAWITCDEAGWKHLLELFAYAILANQTTYQVAVRWHTAA